MPLKLRPVNPIFFQQSYHPADMHDLVVRTVTLQQDRKISRTWTIVDLYHILDLKLLDFPELLVASCEWMRGHSFVPARLSRAIN